MIRKTSVAAPPFLALLALLLAPSPSSAGCTASLLCPSSCSLQKVCPAPYPPNTIFCMNWQGTVSCSGESSCTVGSNSVTCDGQSTLCFPFDCQEGPDWIQCNPGQVVRCYFGDQT